MKLILPTQLHYPLTIIKIAKAPKDEISGGEAIFSYSYNGTTTVGGLDEGYQERSTRIIADFESPLDGILRSLQLSVGQVIESSGLVVGEIEEPCTHPVQYGGLCAICGRDMTELTYSMQKRGQDRAQIAMAHDSMAIKVSREEAMRSEEQSMLRLLKARKLVLVVDLDLTVIHAAIDPTIGEWMADTENPNHAVLQGVRTFELVDDGPFGQSCTYYIKLRPGLEQFLDRMSRHFEMHIYTMGTRSYAESVAKIIDPARALFGDRILSRSESGSLTVKNLKRLFPVDDRMVLVIDDRADVWSWIPNLIKVTPYDFFVGIGDINSSFMPKKQDIGPPPGEMEIDSIAKAEEKAALEETIEKNIDDAVNGADEMHPSEPSISEVTAIEQLVSMTNGDNHDLIKKQTEKQGEALKTQIDERPLLKLQKVIDAEDEDALARTGTGSSQSGDISDSESQVSVHRHRHSLLRDDDTELEHLDRHLLQVHRQFYDTYDKKLASMTSTRRLAEVRGEKHPKRLPQSIKDGAVDLGLVPDVKDVMPSIKSGVLAGVVIVFSGIVPLGVDPIASDIGRWVRSFGASVQLRISPSVTHVIAARAETQKVNQALRHRDIKIVTIRWLLDSLPQWRRLPESTYLLVPQNGEQGSTKLSVPRTYDNDDLSSASSTSSHHSVTLRPLVTNRTRKGALGWVRAENRSLSTPDEDSDSDFLTDTEFPSGDSPLDLADDDWEAIRAEFDDLSDDSGTDLDVDGIGGTSDSELENSISSEIISQSGGRWREQQRDHGVRKRQRSVSSASSGRTGAGELDTKSRLAKRQATARGRESRLKEVRLLEESSKEGTPIPSGGEQLEPVEVGYDVTMIRNSRSADGDDSGDQAPAEQVHHSDPQKKEMEQEDDDDDDDTEGEDFLLQMQAEMRKNSL